VHWPLSVLFNMLHYYASISPCQGLYLLYSLLIVFSVPIELPDAYFYLHLLHILLYKFLLSLLSRITPHSPLSPSTRRTNRRRSSTRKWLRPDEITTKGSGSEASVHAIGTVMIRSRSSCRSIDGRPQLRRYRINPYCLPYRG